MVDTLKRNSKLSLKNNADIPKPKRDYTIHKYVGPTLASGITGASLGAMMSDKGKRALGAKRGGFIGAFNALLWKGVTQGYAKAVNVPYKEVVASEQPKTFGDKAKAYGSAVATAAPIFGLKAILGDLPRKTVEETVEQRALTKLKGKKPPRLKDTLKKAVSGRALYQTAMGGGIGILTAPIYLKGMTLLNSKDKNDKTKGLALLGLSAGIYQGAKGFGEGLGLAKSRGMPDKKIPLALGTAASRIGLKVPAALAMGAAIAAGRKKKDGKDPTLADKLIMPTIISTGVGGAQNMLNTTSAKAALAPKGKKWSAVKGLWKKPKNLGPALKGGAVSGALAGVVGALVVDKTLDMLKKKKNG